MEYIVLFLGSTIKLFALMTPPAVLGAYLSGSRHYDKTRKRQTAVRTSLAVFIIGIVLYFLGQPLFNLFDISLDAFRIGAGTLLFLTAIQLMNETADKPYFSGDDDISVVPLAMPLCMGPATIGTIMVWGAAYNSLADRIITSCALLTASLLILATLIYGDHIKKILKNSGMAIMAKLTGLLLAAIAAQVVFTGIKSFLH